MSMGLKTMNCPSLPSNLNSCFHNTISKHPHFLALLQKWKAELQKSTSNGRVSSEQNLVHVVKDGETLTCISKIYGVSISEIAAANDDILDLDLVFSGHRLKIPSSVKGLNQLDRFVDNNQCLSNQRLDSCSKYSSVKVFASATTPQFRYARTTGYFLLLPLIAFCIRCIIGSLHHRVVGAPKHRTKNELLETVCPGSNNKRWKSALCDLDPDSIDCASRPDSDHFSDEDKQLHDKDGDKAYVEVERDYQKFLSQCGMSRQGYWRGGSASNSHYCIRV